MGKTPPETGKQGVAETDIEGAALEQAVDQASGTSIKLPVPQS